MTTGDETEPTDGVLVVSVWREPETDGGFRARLVSGAGAGGSAESTVVGSRADALAAFERWLDSVSS